MLQSRQPDWAENECSLWWPRHCRNAGIHLQIQTVKYTVNLGEPTTHTLYNCVFFNKVAACKSLHGRKSLFTQTVFVITQQSTSNWICRRDPKNCDLGTHTSAHHPVAKTWNQIRPQWPTRYYALRQFSSVAFCKWKSMGVVFSEYHCGQSRNRWSLPSDHSTCFHWEKEPENTVAAMAAVQIPENVFTMKLTKSVQRNSKSKMKLAHAVLSINWPAQKMARWNASLGTAVCLQRTRLMKRTRARTGLAFFVVVPRT